MTKPDENSTSSSVEDTASAWVIRLDTGKLSLTERVELDDWLDQHESHRKVFVEMQELWGRLDTLTEPAKTAIPSSVPTSLAATRL